MYGETLEYGFLSDSRFGDLVFVQNGKNIQSFKAQKLRIICRIVKYFKKKSRDYYYYYRLTGKRLKNT